MIEFFVPGIPVPQGSKKAFVVNGRAVLVDVRSVELKAWRGKIAWYAKSAYKGDPLLGAIRVDMEFRVPRPKSVKREFPSTMRGGDRDKLERAVHDALTGVIYKDDSQSVEGFTAKYYATEKITPGVTVKVSEL